MSVKTPKVTVIMPVYNVACYVVRAIESIQAQTLEDWELLVVDDGSDDRTGEIVDRFAERDIRIEVIHTKNRGAAAARNVALERARGTYIHFIDGDDWIESSALYDMVALAERDGADLVIAGFYIETCYGRRADKHTTEYKGQPSETFSCQRAFRSAAYRMFDQNLLYSPWNKLFVRKRIEALNIRFRPTFWDDFPFVLDYIRDVRSVTITERAYYHFIRLRAESETSKWRLDMYAKREEEHDWMLDLYEYWDLLDDSDSVEMIQRRYIERVIGCIENLCEPACTLTKHEKKEQISTMILSERAQTAVFVAKPRSRMMSCLLAPIRRKQVNLMYWEGRLIAFVKRHAVKLFAELKARR